MTSEKFVFVTGSWRYPCSFQESAQPLHQALAALGRGVRTVIRVALTIQNDDDRGTPSPVVILNDLPET